MGRGGSVGRLYSQIVIIYISLFVYVFAYIYRLNIAEMKTNDGVNSQLSISRSDRQDSGTYKCVAENPFGTSEHIIYLAVQGNLLQFIQNIFVNQNNVWKGIKSLM